MVTISPGSTPEMLDCIATVKQTHSATSLDHNLDLQSRALGRQSLTVMVLRHVHHTKETAHSGLYPGFDAMALSGRLVVFLSA